MPGERRILLLWACFTVRLVFYCTTLPLWEGYDEWAHFAVVRHMAVRGEILVARQAPIPRDVEASLQLAAVPWEMRALPAPSVTQDGYWTLGSAERERRERALRAMPAEWGGEDGAGAFTAYEALQPPLYYWMMAPALRVCRGLGASLMGEVLTLRLLSALLASLVVPLVFLLGRQVWGDGRAALGCAAVVAVMPGLALDVARVGNDCLAVALFTLLTWLAVKMAREGVTPKLALWTGIVLGLGLLTKAYFLTAIPAIAAVLLYRWWRARGARASTVARAVLLAVIGLLLAGWWYARNLRTTGTLSGLSESLALRGVGAGDMLRQAGGIDWVKAIDAIVFSHLYFGGWSSLTVRSWMYHVFYVAVLAAAVGLLRVRRGPAILTLLAVYLAFWCGQLYNVMLLYLSKGLGGSMGWYMYAVVGAEVTLAVAGLRKLLPARAAGWVAGGGAALFALLDLYTVHGVAIPYYTGMIRHKANGSLGALHWAGFQSVGIAGAVARMAAFVPGALWMVLWLFYVSATVWAVACAGGRNGPAAPAGAGGRGGPVDAAASRPPAGKAGPG
jgi:4-amino-4-deoxy-L-arabinose transferase-like glycosyltransferase